MKEFPLVSVMIAFLNEEAFLKEAIESVQKQEYRQWELLLVDDGSSDSSSAVAKQFAADYPNKIFYLQHENHSNRGLSASRNLAIRNAKGKYVAFLDADDVWLPAYLSNQVELIEKHNVSLICEASDYWYSWQDSTRPDHLIHIGAEQDKVYLPPQLMLNLYPLGKGDAPCPCGMLVKKEVLLKLGGFEESFTGMFEDQVILSKFYLNEPIYISSRHNNLYRQRPNSMVAVSRKINSYHPARKAYFIWLEKYLKKHNVDEAGINRLFRKATFQYRNPKTFYLLKILPRKILRKVKMLVPSFV